MKKIALLPNKEREELFKATALKIGIRPEAIEKDFWVCYMIDHLFHDCEYKDAFVFKGGTSLSKSYHLINRFSEDIDLILDWRKITKGQSDPWAERSKNKQDQYNKQINAEAATEVLFSQEERSKAIRAETDNVCYKRANKSFKATDIRVENNGNIEAEIFSYDGSFSYVRSVPDQDMPETHRHLWM